MGAIAVMSLLIVATLCARVFADAAIYINAVEHPARLSCGTELAVREFAPSQPAGKISSSVRIVSAVGVHQSGCSSCHEACQIV